MIPGLQMYFPQRGHCKWLVYLALDTSKAKLYEVTVKKRDAEKARFVIQNGNGQS